MELNLNSPAYFSEKHGIDNDIYWFMRSIVKHFSEKGDYSEIVKNVGIITVIAPMELLDEGLWAERIKIDKKCNLAIITKQTSYMKYLGADTEGRKKLIVENILASVKGIERKVKFNYGQFEDDMLEFTGFSKEGMDL
jgi:hypothetical protein